MHTNTATLNLVCGYDRNAHKVHCFACNETYDILDLVKQDFNIQDNKEAYKQLCNIYNINDIQYMQDISNNKKVIPLNLQKDNEEGTPCKMYDFTKAINSIYAKQTVDTIKHFKERRAYRWNNSRI